MPRETSVTDSRPGLFAYDREAESSPRQLAILIGIGVLLLMLTLWLFGGEDDEQPPPAASPQIAPAPAPVVSPQPQPPASAAAPSASSSQLVLHGVMGTGANGAAIIAVSGQQRLVRVGREVVPGILLESVTANHALLRERGQTVRLGFPDANGASNVTAVAGRPTGTNAFLSDSEDRRRQRAEYLGSLSSQRGEDGRHSHFELRAGAIPPAFSAAGLQAGDTVLQIGGTRLEGPDDIERIPGILARGEPVAIEIIRNGQRRTINSGGR